MSVSLIKLYWYFLNLEWSMTNSRPKCYTFPQIIWTDPDSSVISEGWILITIPVLQIKPTEFWKQFTQGY